MSTEPFGNVDERQDENTYKHIDLHMKVHDNCVFKNTRKVIFMVIFLRLSKLRNSVRQAMEFVWISSPTFPCLSAEHLNSEVQPIIISSKITFGQTKSYIE